MRTYIVYRTTNNLNGKTYIGCHRAKTIRPSYYGSGLLILRALKKYGKRNFTKEVLFIFDNEEDMFAKEIELIAKLKPDYNIASGGVGDFKSIKPEYEFQRGRYDRSSIDYSKFEMGIKPRLSRHGNASNYVNDGCRCDLCKAAWTEKSRVYRKKRMLYN